LRVYICTDLEGISGVIVWEQTRDQTSAMYQEARRLLMGDVAAAVEGCLEGGATDIVVGDGHGGGFNFLPELMHPGARYLTGRSRPPLAQRLSLYEGYDAGILLGYHAMAGTADGLLRHTQSSKGGNQYWYNGRESGEIAQTSLVLGHFGTPVVMVTGDAAACREATQFLGEGPVTVSVKEGYSAEYGLLLAPEAAHETIRAGACRAMGQVAQCRPYAIDLPIRGRLRLPDKSKADGFSPSRGTRVDDYTFEATFDSALEIYSF